ncbi:MAG: hypothetical protein EBR85_04360 [Betaproteobacteria bacterium]|nr:hypothetical protein [Betaproteobacteria bacterium]
MRPVCSRCRRYRVECMRYRLLFAKHCDGF